MVTLNFFSSSESMKFFTMIYQVTPSVSFFSECLKLFLDFGHTSIGLSDVAPLVISDV